VQTRRSAPSNEALILAFHIAHEDEGAPGSGSMLLLPFCSSASPEIDRKRVTSQFRVPCTLCTRLSRRTSGERIGSVPQIYNSDVAGGSDQIRLACAIIPLFVDPSTPEMTASLLSLHTSRTPHLALKQIRLPPSSLIKTGLSHAAL